MDPEFEPVFGASEYWHVSRGLRNWSHFGACILVLANHFRAHFWNRTIWTRSDYFFSMQPENSKVLLMHTLNTYSFSNNQVENLLHSYQAQRQQGDSLWCTRFRRVFRSRKWTREIEQKPEEDVVWQRNPKPTSYPQTRQDTVVRVFLMESSN